MAALETVTIGDGAFEKSDRAVFESMLFVTVNSE